MSVINIMQDGKQLVFTSKTIDWLVNNTYVSVFNPITFVGYQRQIDESHCQKIVNYLKTESFLPTAIICACCVVLKKVYQKTIKNGRIQVDSRG